MSQTRRLMRRLNGGMGVNCASGPFNQPVDPRTQMAMEQDWKRDRLAEELLKIVCEDASWCSEELQSGKTLAEAALAAATVLYPEVPEVES